MILKNKNKKNKKTKGVGKWRRKKKINKVVQRFPLCQQMGVVVLGIGIRPRALVGNVIRAIGAVTIS
jgi:hypothetical protein